MCCGFSFVSEIYTRTQEENELQEMMGARGKCRQQREERICRRPDLFLVFVYAIKKELLLQFLQCYMKDIMVTTKTMSHSQEEAILIWKK